MGRQKAQPSLIGGWALFCPQGYVRCRIVSVRKPLRTGVPGLRAALWAVLAGTSRVSASDPRRAVRRVAVTDCRFQISLGTPEKSKEARRFTPVGSCVLGVRARVLA